MNPWIQTLTGAAFDLLDPKASMVRIDDIAHALSQLCRFTGHALRHYSVAQHSVHACDIARTWTGEDGPAARVALLHDAAEAYVGDVSSPLKRCLGESYTSLERRAQAAVHEAFGVGADEVLQAGGLVREIDYGLLHVERQQLIGPEAKHWGVPAGLQLHGFNVPAWAPWRASEEFLQRFWMLFPEYAASSHDRGEHDPAEGERSAAHA